MRQLALIACLELLFAGLATTFAQGPELIGRIDGEAYVAKGQVSVTQEAGRGVTTLLSGSEVTITSGYARITLADGGEIDICGPAQLSLLKAGGAITLALSHGRVHARVSAELPLQIYTATVTATPVSVGGLPRDTVIGLSTSGEMCIFAPHGAVRLEHQFSAQRLLVPQLGELSLPGGQIENLREAAGACRCEIPVSLKEPPPQPSPVDPAVRASNDAKSEAEKKEEVPVYTAVMPPLTFSSESPALPPLPHPQIIRLLREVRLRPVVLSGKVEKTSVGQPKPQEPAATTREASKPEVEKAGWGARLKSFFKRLFGRKTR